MFRLMSYLPDMISSSGERNPLDRDGRPRGVEVLMGLAALNSTGVEVNRGLLVWEGWIHSLGESWSYGESSLKPLIFSLLVAVSSSPNTNTRDAEPHMMLSDSM